MQLVNNALFILLISATYPDPDNTEDHINNLPNLAAIFSFCKKQAETS